MESHDQPRSDLNATAIRDLTAGFADAGVRMAFVSPGSRNTPITLALDATPDIETVVIRDERSAAFAALGYAKATGTPAVVSCTSGSAAAHYYPAVVESDQSATPLIVLTADRPLRLRGTSAPQTMDQAELYGTHVKAFVDVDVTQDDLRGTGTAIARTTTAGVPGAVHINIPFDEPLTPKALPDNLAVETATPSASTSKPNVPSHQDVIADADGMRILIVAGGGHGLTYPSALGRFAERLGAVLFADIQCRPASEHSIDHADLLVQSGALEAHPPDLIIRIGRLPTSKAISTWLSSTDTDQILIDRSRLADPLGAASLDLAPADLVAGAPDAQGDRSFVETWRQLDHAASQAVAEATATVLSEPAIARAVLASVPDGTAIFVGSSMPIRDLDVFGKARTDVHIVANRGVNGIDGGISTALGMALAGVETTALIGDVAALHDATALAELASTEAPLRVVVVNNDGGGIFSFLPQAVSPAISEAVFEKYWGTPHGLSIGNIAEALGCSVDRPETVGEFVSVVGEAPVASVVEVHTDRIANVEHHAAVRAAVSDAISR